MKANSISIRPARPDETPVILELIKDLAAYEKLSNEVTATVDDLAGSLFGDRPGAEVFLGEWDGEVAGMAVVYENYSTFRGKVGLHLTYQNKQVLEPRPKTHTSFEVVIFSEMTFSINASTSRGSTILFYLGC